ncbi:hypothetical protein WMY93_007438 [Mugilogobius chulae]|uniref:Putative monooxygenase p33MONOX n=1 Tax=Mugilogobius chulae TaxID=88201 RepID=A0AAW0PCY4_9GOBI
MVFVRLVTSGLTVDDPRCISRELLFSTVRHNLGSPLTSDLFTLLHGNKILTTLTLIMAGSGDFPGTVHINQYFCKCTRVSQKDYFTSVAPGQMPSKALGWEHEASHRDDETSPELRRQPGAPMSTPPHDISINNLWRRPVIPERKFSHLAEEDESPAATRSAVDSALTRPPVVVKPKLQHHHESMSKFEQRAGLSDTGYTPHKGLTAEETRHHHRMPEALQKLQIQSLEHREEKQSSSTQSTPSTTPHSSPRHQRRGWFSSAGSEASITSTSSSSVDLSAGDTVGGAVERWGVFGPRPIVHKSTSDVGSVASEANTAAGFALQAYRGAQKPSPMEVMKSQATRLADPTPQQVNPRSWRSPPWRPASRDPGPTSSSTGT